MNGDQARLVVEHEHVDRRAAAGAPLDLGQRGRDGLAGRRPGEVGESVLGKICAVGSPSVMTRITGSASRCLSRCRRASISACCRLVPCTRSQSWSTRARGLHHAGVVAEADDLDGVLRILRRDQGVQRERGRLRLAPRAAQFHRVRHVDEQGDGGRAAPLGLVDLEVVGRLDPTSSPACRRGAAPRCARCGRRRSAARRRTATRAWRR